MLFGLNNLYRNIRHFRRNEGTTDYMTIPEVTLTGDFVIEFDALINNSVYSQLLSGNNSTINIRNDDGIAMAIGGSQYNFTPSFTRGLFEHVIVTRVGDQVSCSVNGVSETLTIPVVDFNIIHLGRNTTYGTNSPLKGIIANLKIWDNSDANKTAETVSGLGQDIAVGSDLVANWGAPRGAGTLTKAGTWIRSTSAGTNTHGAEYELTGLTVGEQVLVDIEVDKGSNLGTLYLRAGDNPQLSTAAESIQLAHPLDGRYQLILDVTDTTMYVGTISATQGGGQYYDTKLHSVKKVTSYNTLVRQYDLDDNSDILRNRATVLGGELRQLGAAPDGNWVVDTVTGTVSKIGVSSLNFSIAEIEANTTYVVAVRKLSHAIGGPNLRVGGTQMLHPWLTIGSSQPDGGIVSYVVSSPIAGTLSMNGTNSVFEVDNISVRQADGYGTVINGNASDWGLFQQQATGEWLGQELVPQPIEFSSDWRARGVQVGEGISGNRYYTTASAEGQGVSISHNNVGNNLRVQYNVSCDDSFWNLNDWATSDDGELITVSNNNQIGVFDYTPTQSEIYLRHSTTDAITVTLNSFSLKEVLNVA